MRKFCVLLSAVTIIVCFAFTFPALAAPPSVEICNNGIDDDRDRKIDCNDINCVGDPACTAWACANYTAINVCKADPYCEWLGKGRGGYCSDAVSGLPPVKQNLAFLDTSSGNTEGPHETAEAQAGNCTFCHTDLVDNMDDGHAIPTYEPNEITPWPSGKDQSGANGEGNCVFCHYAGVHESDSGPVPIMDNTSNHHNTGFYDIIGTKCGWCHDVYTVHPASISVSAYSIRTCQGCHGHESLHNIQADSDGDGDITTGGELPGFGHVGHNDDCFGCHGYLIPPAAAVTRSASESGAVLPVDPHHGLIGDPMPLDSEAPNASATYKCVSCHMMTVNPTAGSAVFAPVDDCLSCHIEGPATQ